MENLTDEKFKASELYKRLDELKIKYLAKLITTQDTTLSHYEIEVLSIVHFKTFLFDEATSAETIAKKLKKPKSAERSIRRALKRLSDSKLIKSEMSGNQKVWRCRSLEDRGEFLAGSHSKRMLRKTYRFYPIESAKTGEQNKNRLFWLLVSKAHANQDQHHFKASQGGLAKMLGLNRETIRKLLKQLRSDGVVNWSGNSYTMLPVKDLSLWTGGKSAQKTTVKPQKSTAQASEPLSMTQLKDARIEQVQWLKPAIKNELKIKLAIWQWLDVEDISVIFGQWFPNWKTEHDLTDDQMNQLASDLAMANTTKFKYMGKHSINKVQEWLSNKLKTLVA